MSQYASAPVATQSDPVVDVVEAILKVAGLAVALLVALPLVIPLLVLAFLPPGAASKTLFWAVPRGSRLLAAAGASAVGGLLALEAVLLASWVHADAEAVLAQNPSTWVGHLAPGVVPWLIGNLLSGLLLLPAIFGWRRRRIAKQIKDRRFPDVVIQERIEAARKHAADLHAGHRIGVRLNARTGEITGTTPRAITAPHPVHDQPAFGIVARPTVSTLTERLQDRRRIRAWIDRTGRWVQLPPTAGAVRALLIAESGSGKTVLLNGVITAALARNWPVVFIDGKGDPADGERLAARARAAGHTASVARRWDLFAGNSPQIVEKLMRLLPLPDGANQHYLDEARAVLAAIQAHAPLTSTSDLQQRLTNPLPHLRDHADRDLVTAVVDSRSGLTAAGRVLQTVATALRPLEPWLAPTGWSYRTLHDNLTVVPLSPADAAQARLGDLLLLDLRHALADRLAHGTTTPLLVVVDEFAQLASSDTDPGDTAAALFETARSAGVGLVLAAQSAAGLSPDDTRRARALASGAALILGRSKDPEDVVRYAGTMMRMEASGAAAGEELRSARAQHTWLIPPQDVREAWDGAFWLIQAGATAPFRALPPARVPTIPTATEHIAQLAAEHPPTASTESVQLAAVTGPAAPTPRVPRPSGLRTATPAASVSAGVRSTSSPREGVTGFEIEAVQVADTRWHAVAYPATDDFVLDDETDPESVTFTVDQDPAHAPAGVWTDQWHPTYFTRWNETGAVLPDSWTGPLDLLLQHARVRHNL